LAWTSFDHYLHKEHPFDDKFSRDSFDLICNEQWDHLRACERCRNPDSYDDECLKYEARMWMLPYTSTYFDEMDPVVLVVRKDRRAFSLALLSHAEHCPRHAPEYPDLMRRHLVEFEPTVP
jgi:hypothetical protein